MPEWHLSGTVKASSAELKIQLHKNVPRAAADGVAFIDIDTSPKVLDEIYQDVMTEPNTEYELTVSTSKLPELESAYSSFLFVYWDGNAEGSVGGTPLGAPNKWQRESLRLFTTTGGVKRLAFREYEDGAYFGGDGKAPLVDFITLCKVGPAQPPVGRVLGPPYNKRLAPEPNASEKITPWILPASRITTVNGQPRALFFGGESPVTTFEEPRSAAQQFLEQHEIDLGLQGISEQLDAGTVEVGSGWRVAFRQLYNGIYAGRKITFFFEPNKRLEKIQINVRRIQSAAPLEYPQDTTLALQAALRLVRAEHITDPQPVFVKQVYIDLNGHAKPVFRVWLNNERIRWMVVVDAQTNETYGAEDLQI